MILFLLVVVGLCIPGVISRAPFNFRGSCYVSHLANTFSARCDGSSKHISTKDVFLDNRTTASMSQMDLTNFGTITLDSNVIVEQIKITNTKNVSLYISNTRLKHLVIESVDVLTLKHHSLEKPMTRNIVGLTILNVNLLKFINEGRGVYDWPINTVTIGQVNDFALESLQLNIVSENVSITNTKIRLKGPSSLHLEAASSHITNDVIYIQDGGIFSIKVNSLSVIDSVIEIENGYLQLLKYKNVIFEGNSLYGFQNKSLSILDQSVINFLNNDIFSNDIVDLLTFKQDRTSFKDNKFGCTGCGKKDKLMGVDLKDVGDVNYCYTGCEVSLNTYKALLSNYCVCGNGETLIDLKQLCDQCIVRNETNSLDTLFDGDALRYSLLAIIPLILIVSILYCVCHKVSMHKLPVLTVIGARKFDGESKRGSQDSQVAIFRKSPKNESNDGCSNNFYEPVGETVILR